MLFSLPGTVVKFCPFPFIGFKASGKLRCKLLGGLALLGAGSSMARAQVIEAWVQRSQDPSGQQFAHTVGIDGFGNVVVGGSWGSDRFTAKYAAEDGALVWQQRPALAAGSPASVRALAIMPEGDVIVTGPASSLGGDQDYATIRYAAADGRIIWEARYQGPAGSHDVPAAMVLDAAGNSIVTGTSNNGSAGTGVEANGNDFYTAKYAANNGALVWERRYNGPGNRSDTAAGVAVDNLGNVVVTGTSRSDSNGDGLFDNDYYTAKYAASDGALIWEKRYDGLLNVGDLAAAVTVDHQGNVLVTGSSGGFYTAKYASADGTLLWSRRYQGPGPGSDAATAIAVDGSGNVFVTGASASGAAAQDLDFYTAKYAAGDGTLLWEKRYNGPGNGDDRATALAVDAKGNVVVTGTSTSPPVAFDTFGDYYTAKYAAADGSLIWEKFHNGPANGGDSASGMALAPNGLVAVTGSSDSDAGTGIRSSMATVLYREIPPAASFAGWVAGIGLYGAAASPEADPDRDGIMNAAEYILGGIPVTPDPALQPTITRSGQAMLVSFFRVDSSETPDITLTVSTGTDLVSWPQKFNIGATTATSTPGVTIMENGSNPDLITVTLPSGQGASRFARMEITVAP
jgi:hypothetical protein